MADLGYIIDYKIKNTIDNKLNPYIKMIKDKMRDIDNKSVTSVLEVKKLLDDFLREYNQFRIEVADYVSQLEDVANNLIAANEAIDLLKKKDTELENSISSLTTQYNNLLNMYNAHLSMKYYSVSHFVNGGSGIKNYAILEGQKINAPTTEKEGFNFVDWYLDSDYGTVAQFPLTINDNMELYAKWEEKVYYTITFISPYSTPEPIRAENGTTVNLPVLTYPEYNFEGWYSDPDYTNKVNDSIVIDGNITLYAKWSAVYYTITFITPYGVVDPVIARKGEEVVLPELTYAGYTFKGWYDSDLYETLLTSPLIVSKTMSVYAKWEQAVERVHISDLGIRYIKWSMSRNNLEYSNIFVEMMALNKEGGNVALHKPSWTSANPTPVTDSFVNDGEYHNLSTDASTGAVSIRGKNVTVYIDLQQPEHLDKLRFWCYYHSEMHIYDMRIQVSEDGISYYEVFRGDFTTNAGGSAGPGTDVDLSTMKIADTTINNYSETLKNLGIRYIRAKSERNSKNFAGLMIAELEAYVNGENVALNKPVRIDGKDNSWKPNSKMVDGILYGQTVNSKDGYVWARHNRYIELDLGQVYNLDSFRIFPYDRESSIWYGVQVEVSNDGITFYKIEKTDANIKAVSTAQSAVHISNLDYPMGEFLLTECPQNTNPTIP